MATDELDDLLDPAKEIRSAITMMVQGRLAAQKALGELKRNTETLSIDYESAIEELENVIEQMYATETSLGEAHQFTIVSLATEGVML